MAGETPREVNEKQVDKNEVYRSNKVSDKTPSDSENKVKYYIPYASPDTHLSNVIESLPIKTLDEIVGTATSYFEGELQKLEGYVQTLEKMAEDMDTSKVLTYSVKNIWIWRNAYKINAKAKDLVEATEKVYKLFIEPYCRKCKATGNCDSKRIEEKYISIVEELYLVKAKASKLMAKLYEGLGSEPSNIPSAIVDELADSLSEVEDPNKVEKFLEELDQSKS